jgi:serine/threonine protein kinase
LSDDTTPEKADVNPGDQVAGYRVEEQIGQGGMAVVYRAHDERLDRRVALKVLAPGFAADNAFRTRFIRESRAAASVDHPNILPVYDAGDAGGCLFISMRYVQGGDVRSLIADGTALAPTRAWNIISQVASALDAAHARDLVHRDVKPANMLIDRGKDTGKGADGASQSREHVYLSDFGISKQTVASNLTSTGQFVGTLDYIAPEQIEGQRIDGRADQYSLACAAYELLSGAPPFIRSNGFALINSHL